MRGWERIKVRRSASNVQHPTFNVQGGGVARARWQPGRLPYDSERIEVGRRTEAPGVGFPQSYERAGSPFYWIEDFPGNHGA